MLELGKNRMCCTVEVLTDFIVHFIDTDIDSYHKQKFLLSCGYYDRYCFIYTLWPFMTYLKSQEHVQKYISQEQYHNKSVHLV